jgi:hypothetical protein
MPADLKLPCALATALMDDLEFVTVEQYIDQARHDLVWLAVTDVGADATSVYLDEERARALFNWLGAWLHGNRSTTETVR